MTTQHDVKTRHFPIPRQQLLAGKLVPLELDMLLYLACLKAQGQPMKLPSIFYVSTGLLLAVVLAAGLWFFNKSHKPGAVDFVEHVYTELYHPSSTSSSLDKADEIYSSALLNLIKKEQQQQIASGEMGKISADPLCNCQDPTSVEVTEIVRDDAKNDHATVLVTLSVSGMMEKIKLDLVRQGGHWKIDDVMGNQIPSLRSSLFEE